MLKTLTVLSLTIGLGWTAMVRADQPASQGHPDSSKWENLFSKDLSDAVFPKGVWYFEGDVLTATEDQNIWTKKEYENFIIDLEFKNAEGTNSGVFVYGSDLKNWIPNSVEIQIDDDFSPKWSKCPKTWQCASIFGRLAPTKSLVKKPGEWNRMTITSRGPHITVVLNGEQVTEIDMRQWTSAKKNPDGSAIPPWLNRPLAEMATKGHVGLQGKHGGAPIYFRNMKVKRID
jgi:hypothetical protein